jgi:dienelactone hydrolase
MIATIAVFSSLSANPVSVLKTIDPAPIDITQPSVAIDAVAPAIQDGGYRLSFSLAPVGADGKTAALEPVVLSTPIKMEKGIGARVAAAKARAAKAAAALKANGNKPLLAALPSAEYPISLYDLANSGAVTPDRINFGQQLDEANRLLAAIESGTDPFAGRRGDLRRAYHSQVDDTLQPYRVFVPASYDPAKKYPVIIALHGMGRDENSYFDDYSQGAFKVEAESRGYIVACPKGRQPASMYFGSAERDVLDVLGEVRRDYNIDPDRVYMTGHSMGGFGTWSIAMNHPGLFAALAPVAGGGNPAGMAKIAHIPQLVVHGDNDKTVPVERSRVMVAAAKKLNVTLKYIEIPGGDHIFVAQRTFKDVFDWFDSHRRSADAAAAAAGGSKTSK